MKKLTDIVSSVVRNPVVRRVGNYVGSAVEAGALIATAAVTLLGSGCASFPEDDKAYIAKELNKTPVVVPVPGGSSGAGGGDGDDNSDNDLDNNSNNSNNDLSGGLEGDLAQESIARVPKETPLEIKTDSEAEVVDQKGSSGTFTIWQKVKLDRGGNGVKAVLQDANGDSDLTKLAIRGFFNSGLGGGYLTVHGEDRRDSSAASLDSDIVLGK